METPEHGSKAKSKQPHANHPSKAGTFCKPVYPPLQGFRQFTNNDLRPNRCR